MANFVTISSGDNKIKLKNFYHTGVVVGFSWILFHFTIIYFFGVILQSIFLVGLFLGVGNFLALLIDIPIGELQKYFKSKTFFLFGIILMILSSFIFLKFILYIDVIDVTDLSPDEKFSYYLKSFLNSGLNIFFILFLALLYGIIKESFDVTALSYIFNNSMPSEYASILSKYNIHFGVGSFLGLILSGFLLASNKLFAITIFLILLIIFFIFVLIFFNNNKKNLHLTKSIKLDIHKNEFLSGKKDLVGKITMKSFIDLSKKSKIILLKPIEIKNKIDFNAIIESSIKSFKVFFSLIFVKPRNLIIIWFLLVIMQYGFWDTFVATYQIEFLNSTLKEETGLFRDIINKIGGGYVLLGMLIIPAFVLQGLFINLSKKIGTYKVIMFGFLLSSFSLILFGLTSGIYNIIIFGLLNSVGYAASMPVSQASFSWLYNQEYSKKFNLNEIDTTVSAAPLKIILNLTNITGLLLGSILITFLGFKMFFIVFGFILMCFFTYTILKMKKIMKLFSEKEIGKKI